MKKILALILVLATVMSFVACGKSEEEKAMDAAMDMMEDLLG